MSRGVQRRQGLTMQQLWDKQRLFFNHPGTQFRVAGRVAKAQGYGSLQDANRAARRAARYARNGKRPPPSHIKAKLDLLELRK